ncbi:unnamed protein product [Parajaminaea phylloscopi]
MADAEDQDIELTGATSAAAALAGPASGYRYLQEISQMMFVFGRVVDPPRQVVEVVEDIVRHQVIQMIIQARSLSILRHARTLSPEDFIFLVRYDRAKVNRLRTYLSWKDVRKNAKEDGGGGGAGDVDLNAAVEDVDMAKAQGSVSRKLRVKLPWEISSTYSDYVVPGAVAAAAARSDDAAADPLAPKAPLPNADEDLDDDDQEAMRESLKRLKEADDATLRMTREEYEHYSDCRAASFTFRKAKKFRDFISSSTYLDVRPNDDIVDVLGFLAFEVVREITLGAKAAWEQERQIAQEEQAIRTAHAHGAQQHDRDSERGRKRKRAGGGDGRARDSGSTSGEGSSGRESRNKSSSADEQHQRIDSQKPRSQGSHADSPRKGQPQGTPSRQQQRPSASPEKDRRQSSPSASSHSPSSRGAKATEHASVDPITRLYMASSEEDIDADRHLPAGASFCGLFGVGPVEETGEAERPALPSAVVGRASSPEDPSKTRAQDANAVARDGGSDEAAAVQESDPDAPKSDTRRAEREDKDGRDGHGSGDDEGDKEEEEESPALLPYHIREAFARLQRDKTRPALSSGTRNVGQGPLGGLRRTRMWVI